MSGLAQRRGNAIELDLSTYVSLTQTLNGTAFANANKGRYYAWGPGGEIYQVNQSDRDMRKLVGTITRRGDNWQIATSDPTLKKDIRALLFQKPVATMDAKTRAGLAARLGAKGYTVGTGVLASLYKKGSLSHYVVQGSARRAVYRRVLVGTIRKAGNRFEIRSLDPALRKDTLAAIKMMAVPEKREKTATATRL